MTVQTSSAAFRRAVTIASKVVERRSTIPILSMVRCHANGKLEVLGTDLDIALSAEVERVAGPPADFILDAPRNIVSALSAAGGSEVLLDYKDGKANVTSDTLRLRVNSLAVDDFPAELTQPLDVKFSVTLGADLIAAIARVAGAMSSEETRYYLNGVVLEKPTDGHLRLAATDGHRLYFADVPAPNAVGELPGGIIIPRKVIGLLLDLAKSSKDGVRVEVGPQAQSNRETSTAPAKPGLPRFACSFTEGGTSVRMCAKTIDGTFPDYRRVVPREKGKQALFQVADLRRAVAAVSGHSRHVRAVKLSLTESGALLAAAYVDTGLAAEMTIPCEHRNTGFEIGFNGGYLASILDAARGEEIVFEFGDTASPVLVRNPADTSWTGVLMPMRV